MHKRNTSRNEVVKRVNPVRPKELAEEYATRLTEEANSQLVRQSGITRQQLQQIKTYFNNKFENARDQRIVLNDKLDECIDKLDEIIDYLTTP